MNEQISSLPEIPFSTGCEIAAVSPCGLIAINKKAGRASHPNPAAGKNDKPPMVKARYNFDGEYYSWLDKDGQKHRLYLVNRLDSPTSGIILAGFDPDAVQAAKEQFRARNVRKKYAAIVLGNVVPKFGEWNDRLSTQKFAGFVRSVSGRMFGAHTQQKASAHYNVEAFDQNSLGLSLITLEPHTGLTHQLRVQCATRRCPILGDATYGDFARNKRVKALTGISRLFLHCLETSLEIELRGEKIAFSANAPLPESFEKIIRYNPDIKKRTLNLK